MSQMIDTFKRLKRTNPEITGVWRGLRSVGGKVTSESCLVVGVPKKLSLAALKSLGIRPIPRVLGSLATDVVTAPFRIYEDGGRYRPAPGGVSVAEWEVTAGTLGAWFRRSDTWAMLSNNHVLGNSNLAPLGSEILQPGPHDGGERLKDRIATLTDFEELAFDGSPPPPKDKKDKLPARLFWRVAKGIPNTLAQLVGCPYRLVLRKQVSPSAEPGMNIMDAAIATPTSNEFVRPDIIGIGTIAGPVVAATLGLQVKKRGRTTELQQGTVSGLDAVVQVSGYPGGTATFVDQIVVGGEGFSAGGDSGSLIVTAATNQPVALLFAGGGGQTIGNPIQPVLDRFQLEVP